MWNSVYATVRMREQQHSSDGVIVNKRLYNAVNKQILSHDKQKKTTKSN